MEIETRIITSYLNDEEIPQDIIWLIPNTYKPDIKRKDVTQELLHQTQLIAQDFPCFNKPLWNTLWKQDPIIKDIILCPLAGTAKAEHATVVKKQKYYIRFDLIQFANMTPIVSQMVYMISNFLMNEITKILIHYHYPISGSASYLTKLNHICFCDGLAAYLSWGESCDAYKFYTDKYEAKKETAFAMLFQSLKITDVKMQKDVISHLYQQDFWLQFPIIAGIFYFDDIYRSQGIDGILDLYKKGPENFIQHLFQLDEIDPAIS